MKAKEIKCKAEKNLGEIQNSLSEQQEQIKENWLILDLSIWKDTG